MAFLREPAAAERRKSAAMLDSEPAMNATGKRRQMELLGSRVSSAVRCSSSKRNACQSKRRVCAVTASERPFRRDAGARSAGAREASAKLSPRVSLFSSRFTSRFTRGLLRASWGPPRSDRPQRFRREALLFSLCLKNRMTFLQSLRICQNRLADGRKEGDRSYVVKHLLQLGATQ